MSQQKFNEQVAKMRSLMERMEGKMTPYEAILNEEQMINEALDNRELVTANSLYDLIEQMKAGGFASFGYITGANLNYPTVSRRNPETGRMKGFPDMESVGQKLKYQGDLIGGIIKFTRYIVNWSTPDSISKNYSDWKTKFNSICDEYGCEDGKIKDKENSYKKKTDYGDSKFFDYKGQDEAKKDHQYVAQNLHNAKIISTYYLIDINGEVIREVEKNEILDYFKPKNKYTPEINKVIKALNAMGTEENKVQEVIDRLGELNMRYQNFLLDSILYIAAATKKDDGTTKKVIFINDKLKDVFGDVKVKPERIRRIEQEKRDIDLTTVSNAVENSY